MRRVTTPPPRDRPAAPLAGVRVVEIAGLGPAPFACLLLAELGADVVRIDRPDGGDPLAAATGLGRSRPSVAVDLKHPDGPGVVRRLAADADVLVEGLRPGVTERLGIGPDTLLADNPRLVYARMTGWGQEGPRADEVGHDITYAALSGALSLSGPADRPLPPANLLDGGAPFYSTYACADGRHVAVGALEPRFYAALLDALGLTLEGGQHDQTAWPEHRRAIAEVFATRTRDEWAERLAGTEACVAPVLDLGEAPHDPHLLARGTFADLDGHPTPRVAPRFSSGPPPDPTPTRAPGADTRVQLAARGFTADEVDALLASGAVAETPQTMEAPR